jgi:hypothetical protein
MLEKLNCGKIKMTPFFVCGTRIEAEYTCKINKKRQTAHIFATEKDFFKDDMYLQVCGGGVVCKRIFQNKSQKTLALKELGIRLDGITFDKHAKDDYFYHTENPRIYQTMTFPIDYDRTGDAQDSDFDILASNKWADPGVVTERIGASPYQPFPAILIGNYASKSGLVHGTLNQDVFFHNYLASHAAGAVRLDILSSFKGIAYLDLASGASLTDEWYLGKTDHADDIEKIFEAYTNVLRNKLAAGYGASRINRDNMVWGSWNDGIFRDISEKMLTREAEFLKDNFPTVKWIQVDDGYSACDTCADGIGVPYAGETGIDPVKFPDGLRALTDKIREIGLRPALWIGGCCPVETKIYQDHPAWFIDYTRRMTKMQPLDVSQNEVRAYMTRALDILCLEYGFEGVKHDFWSYPFEDGENNLKEKNLSGYQHRQWWLSEIRKRLPADGYLQTGCDIVMGNPFLGKYFTNYRYGIDIGLGNWENVKTNFLWGAACFATHTGDLFVPNSDSVGLFPGLNDTDAMFCVNYCLCTHSMVEISGRLSLADPRDKRLKILKKAACNPNNGQDVYFAGYDYRSRDGSVPNVLFFKTPHFSVGKDIGGLPICTAGFFNIDETDKEITLKPPDLGLKNEKYIAVDV